MGKAFAIVGIILLALVAGCFGCLWLMHGEGSSVQEDFYALLATGDAEKVHAAFHPTLAEEIDVPVLAEWMKAVDERLGKFQGMGKTDMGLTTKSTDKGKLFEFRGTATFEKGEAKSMVRTLDGKYAAFHVESELLKNWFTGVTCTDGSGSPRVGPYENLTDAEMAAIRVSEQDKAAVVGEYEFQVINADQRKIHSLRMRPVAD